MILLQRYDRKSSCFQLRLCNKKLANLSFTVDISKSVNLDPASWGGLQERRRRIGICDRHTLQFTDSRGTSRFAWKGDLAHVQRPSPRS